MFEGLDASGSFHRDSRLGRIFHPGTASYREISPTDSLHIAVTPENHVSVHVDRVSPLATGAGRRSRYSLPRVVRHVVAFGVDSIILLRTRHHGDQRCELDCETVTATVTVSANSDDQTEAAVLFEFSCRAAGAVGCRWKTTATTEEELLARVTEHARTVHGVASVSNTLINYARKVALRH